MNMGMGGMLNMMGVDEEMAEQIIGLIGDANFVCGIFNFIPFDPSWGVGSAQNWNDSCQSVYQMVYDMMHLFEHMYQYGNKEFTAEFCHTLSAPIKVMVPEIAELVDSAHGPCHCVAHNIM